jgi:F-type H+-transporting ATPase subunit c
MPAPTEYVDWARVAAYLAAGICMGVGALGPSLGQGYTGGKACEAIGKKPESSGVIMRTMIAAMAVTESSAIYAFIISIVLVLYAMR